MNSKHLLAAAALAVSLSPAKAITVTFDDLPNPPALTGAVDIQEAIGTGSLFDGVMWGSNVEVVGRLSRVDPGTPGPVFGLPHSGDYFITNGGNGAQGVSLTTTQVLTGAWFGEVQYYGFVGSVGADQITINALHNGTTLASITYDLPRTAAGYDVAQPEPMTFVDTSSFESLSGITGYTIDHHAPAQFADNWAADDFEFVSAAVPEPAAMGWVTGVLTLGFVIGRRCRR